MSRYFVVCAPLSLLVLASCRSSPESNTVDPLQTATPQPTANATPLRRGENVAGRGVGRGSTKTEEGHLSIDEETAHNAIDGDSETVWSSGQHPTQWFSVALDGLYMIHSVELVTAQAPPGPTTHEVWLGNATGTRTLYKRLSDVYTEDGQTLNIVIVPPRVADEVLVLTLESPCWVAWRELRVFWSPAANLAERLESGLKLVKNVSGFEFPVQVTQAGDGSGRIFVVEQKNSVLIMQDGVIQDDPFLDIADRVSCCGEQGLLNLAFPPSFPAIPILYVSYTNIDGVTVVSRFATSGDPNKVDQDSGEIILTIDQPDAMHNGGHLAFGPQDGFLYIGSGDGGLWYENAGQEPTSLRGKILRIDVRDPEIPYRVPDRNPYSQIYDFRGEIWAQGIRNPWGFAFDPQTGDLFILDVGNSHREEVNFQPATGEGGENYGWPIMEGPICFEYWPCDQRVVGLTAPVAEFDHTQGGAVVGGAVYRGSGSPELQGLFLFADFCSGRIWGLKPPQLDSQNVWQTERLANASVPIRRVGKDEEANIYVTGYQDGAVYMLVEQ